jgi:hypothetical protein
VSSSGGRVNNTPTPFVSHRYVLVWYLRSICTITTLPYSVHVRSYPCHASCIDALSARALSVLGFSANDTHFAEGVVLQAKAHQDTNFQARYSEYVR